jgi:seryl-tRNA synthetase
MIAALPYVIPVLALIFGAGWKITLLIRSVGVDVSRCATQIEELQRSINRVEKRLDKIHVAHHTHQMGCSAIHSGLRERMVALNADVEHIEKHLQRINGS